VEITWLISLIWISNCSQTKGTHISNIRRHRKDQQNSPWVAATVAAMAPHTVQVNSFAWNKKLSKYVKHGQPEKVMLLFQ
jgi:hypothetical protein